LNFKINEIQEKSKDSEMELFLKESEYQKNKAL
jgi:hypothetical protein